MDNKYLLNPSFKDIAKDHTAFCIFGGPSSNETQNIDNIIKNNFTVTVNHSIAKYPNVDLFLTADNLISREYFEDKEFFSHKFIGGKMIEEASQFKYKKEPTWIQGKRNTVLSQNPNLIKIIGCCHFPCYNHNFSSGQLYKYYGVEYCKEIPNTYLCLLHKDANNDPNPVLSLTLPETVDTYGTDMGKIIVGGNVSGILLQVLWYMGFSKVITVGLGDNGKSTGYSEQHWKEAPTKGFEWSNASLHSVLVHNKIWGKNLKTLHGGDVFRDYCDFPKANYDELETTPEKKNQLINKLISNK